MAESADDPELFWVDPERRGILPLDGFHVPRRLRRTRAQRPVRGPLRQRFRGGHRAAAPRRPTKRPNTWINDEIVRLYTRAASPAAPRTASRCWHDGELVGGLYGVSIGGAFFGESMFSRVTDASKVALVHLVARLRLGGFALLDTQFVTPHLARFGAIEIPRAHYRRLLAEALRYRASFRAIAGVGRRRPAGVARRLCSRARRRRRPDARAPRAPGSRRTSSR